MAYITINKQNFYHNLNQIALKAGSVEKIAIVLKDNAYGHGLELMAKLASEFGIIHAVVRNESEAQKIKSLFKTTLVLGGKCTKLKKCHYVINNLEQIYSIPRGTEVELKVDTGMRRNGITPDQLEQALHKIDKQGLEIVGLMTHYRSADELSSELFWQMKKFDEVKERLKALGIDNFRIHSCNSAATLRQQECNEDIVRVGISAYGYNELAYPFDSIDFMPVLSLYAQKISTRVLQTGERLGYGGEFTAPQEMNVSSYDVGYGDGWSRGDAKQPYVTSDGLEILGRVSMDMVSLESTLDTVCIMNDAQEAAKYFGTISYEMLTALSYDIERRIV